MHIEQKNIEKIVKQWVCTTKQKSIAYQLLKTLKISQKPAFLIEKMQDLCYTIFSRKCNY